MRWSYKIFRAFGIDVRVHATFFFIVAYFAYVWGVTREPGGIAGAAYGIVLVVLLFALVVMHELTHSLVARSFGVGVRDITLLPIGGMAAMEEMPTEPRQELLVAVAGPVSNIVVGLIMAVLAPVLIDTSLFGDFGRLSDAILAPGFQGAYLYLLFVNVMLAAFNLLPAFPMDGGRVFRSILAMRMGRAKATRVAVGVGQVLAIGLGLLGVFGGGVMMVVVAVFIFFGAQTEGRGDEMKGVLQDLRVAQAVNVTIETALPEQSIGDLAARLFHTYQADFPVVAPDGSLLGVVTRDRLISLLGQHGPDFPVSEAMRIDVPTGGLADSVYDAFQRMQGSGSRVMPIVERGRFIGMVSLEDIGEVFALLSATGPEFAGRVPREPR